MFCTKFASLCRYPTSLVRRLGPHSLRHPSLTKLHLHHRTLPRTLPIRAGKHLGAYSVQLNDARCFTEGNGRPEEPTEMSEEERQKFERYMDVIVILSPVIAAAIAAWYLVFKDAGQLSSEQAPVTVEERRALGRKYLAAYFGIYLASITLVQSTPFRCMWKHPVVCFVGGWTVSSICNSVVRRLPYDYEKRFDHKHGAWLTSAVFYGVGIGTVFAWSEGSGDAPALARRVKLPIAVAITVLFVAISCYWLVIGVSKKDKKGKGFKEDKNGNTPFDPMSYFLID